MLFPHLNIRSDFSFFRGAATPRSYVEEAARRYGPGGADGVIGICDQATLAGAVELATQARQAGLRPAIGTVTDIRVGDTVAQLRLHVLSEKGWSNLCRLFAVSSRQGRPVDGTDLAATGDGLAAVIPDAPTGAGIWAGDDGAALLSSAFGDRVFFEDLRCPRQEGAPAWRIDWKGRDAARRFAADARWPLLGAAPVVVAAPEALSTWRLWRAIGENETFRSDWWPGDPGCHLLTEEEMTGLFADAPAALAGARRLAAMADWAPSPRPPLLPRLPGRASGDTEMELRQKTLEGLRQRCEAHGRVPTRYQARADYELSQILRMGFSDYFLIVAEFCGWARENGIAVGPGRGSGAGSLVAWAVGITGIDPIKHGLLFERFINPERVSLPDFDIDFDEVRRDDVIEHVTDVYGAAAVARIATYAHVHGRTAVKDVSRTLGLPFSVANTLSDMVPPHPGGLAGAMTEDTAFRRYIQADQTRVAICRLAATVEGLRRQAGMHAAGVIIAPGDLSEHTPLTWDRKSGQAVCEFEMKTAEAWGLVKFDFLGLSTLSIIQRCRDLLTRSGIQLPPATEDMSGDDPDTLAMLADGRSFGVFQYDQMGGALRRLAPRTFADLAALNALYRPGPIGYIPTYAERARRLAAGEVPDWAWPPPAERTEPILRETHGIMVYQEQVMEIARACAGYSLGQSDLLRRAIGKKIPHELAAHRSQFIDGCVTNAGMPPADAERLFDDIERFANYGFNKSHAVAYALIGYATAFLKRHHPAAWFAACLDFERSQDRSALLAEEAQACGVRLLPVSINRSGPGFGIEQADGRWAIRCGMLRLKGFGAAGAAGIEAICAERRKAGRFASLVDYRTRCSGMLPISQQSILAAAGAFDEFGMPRRRTEAWLRLMHDIAQHRSAARHRSDQKRAAAASEPDLFGAPGQRAAPASGSAPSGDSEQSATPSSPEEWCASHIRSFAPRVGRRLQEQCQQAATMAEFPDRTMKESRVVGFLCDRTETDALIARVNRTGSGLRPGVPGSEIARVVGTIADIRREAASKAAGRDGTEGIRGLTCVEVTSLRWLSARPAMGDRPAMPAAMAVEIRGPSGRTEIWMSRARSEMTAVAQHLGSAAARGRPVVLDLEVVPAATLGRRRAETRLVRAFDIDDVQMPWAAGDLVIRIDGAECAKLENIEPRIRTALETSGDRGAMGRRRVFLALGSSARMLDGVWPYGQETQPALLDVPGVTGVGAFGPAGGGVKRPVAPAAAERQSAGGANGPLDATI